MTRLHPCCVLIILIVSAPSLFSAEPALSSPGLDAWQKGQKALLEGHSQEAIECFQQSLKLEPSLTRSHLSLAAAYLAQAQEEQAAEQLNEYLQAQPEHYLVRGQYAEVLWRLDRLADAREQFERFEADLQDHESQARDQLVNCQGRLMNIAERSDDEYGRHLHRGIALYWLARQRAEIIDGPEELSTESLLCQSASELVLARHEGPEEARPCWYLHEVWSQLGQRQPAQRWLRAAEKAALLSYLTPAEQRRLHFAVSSTAKDGSRK
jgi:tetratricopeptide (TPR) repeat protein